MDGLTMHEIMDAGYLVPAICIEIGFGLGGAVCIFSVLVRALVRFFKRVVGI